LSITINDINKGPAYLEHKLSWSWSDRRKNSAVDHFCLGYQSQKEDKFSDALGYYEKAAQGLKGEAAFYARYQSGIIAQQLDHPWPEIEERLLGAFQCLPERGEPILKIIHYYQWQQQWPIAYLYSKFAKEQFYGRLPAEGLWGLDKGLYTWKVLDVHKVSCYHVGNLEEATKTYSMLCRLVDECPDSFMTDDITRIVRQKFLFPAYDQSSSKYHLH
jgi:hypothetical protein